MFKAYFKTTDPKSKELNSSSHGLGLNICYRICAGLKGHLAVKSEPGQTEFKFTFNAKKKIAKPSAVVKVKKNSEEKIRQRL